MSCTGSRRLDAAAICGAAAADAATDITPIVNRPQIGDRRVAGRRPGRRLADAGFTLVEILIAIVLVGILSAVVVVGISSLTGKGQAAACSASLDAARTGSAVYQAGNSAYPTTILAMTSATPPALVLPAGVRLNDTASGSIKVGTIATGAGWSLTMLAGVSANAPSFSCSDAVPSPTCPGTFAGWTGEYYANPTLSGPPALCRDDATVAFSWGTGSPGAGIPADGFSARWSRTINFPAGTYDVTVGSDDGMRVFVDGVSAFDWWSDHLYSNRTLPLTLTSGPHSIVIEYYDSQGLAQIVVPNV